MAQIYPARPDFYKNVSKGGTGSDTAQVQTWLNNARKNNPAIEPLTVDGKFGAATERAVKTFQSSNGLKADGIVGANTWPAIYSRHADAAGAGYVYPGIPVREGDSGAVVKAIQQKLITTVPGLAPDGVFGRRTRGAVSAFQTLNGLTADGVVGPATFAKLFNT